MSTYIVKRSVDLQKPIEDAKEPLVLEVKPIDVVRATDKNSKVCAYARACERQFKEKGVEAAFFFRTAAYLEYEDKLVRYFLPGSVQKEIVAFDRHKTMEPGTYQLTPPPPTKTRKALAKRKREDKSPPVKDRPLTKIKRSVVHRTQGIRSLAEPSYRSRA